MNPFDMVNGGASGNVGMVRSFSTLARAESAKAAVLALGVPADAAQLQVLQDEAGPVEGNFLVGNGHESEDASAYGSNFVQPVARGTCLLLLSSVPDGQRQEVEAAMSEFGGVDVDAAASRGSET